MEKIEIKFSVHEDGHVEVTAAGHCTEYEYISLMACGVESVIRGMAIRSGAGKAEYLGLLFNELFRNIEVNEGEKE